jgi:hypothetical protein
MGPYYNRCKWSLIKKLLLFLPRNAIVSSVLTMLTYYANIGLCCLPPMTLKGPRCSVFTSLSSCIIVLLAATQASAENPDHVARLKKTKQCSGCDLSGANLSKLNLKGAFLKGANLRSADVSNTNLIQADLEGAIITGANLRGSNLIGANLRNAKLNSVDLSEAKLMDANLAGATLVNANFHYANFTGADMSGTNLNGGIRCRLAIAPDGSDGIRC